MKCFFMTSLVSPIGVLLRLPRLLRESIIRSSVRFRAEGSGFRAWGLGYKVWGLGFRV